MVTKTKIRRTKRPKSERFKQALLNPYSVKAERCRRSFSFFVKEFWDTIIEDDLIWNWHMDVLCDELQEVASRVANKEPKAYDVVINVPPGSTKSTICTVMFPDWCWTSWYWMRFICAGYSGPLSLEHAGLSRDIVKSDKFKKYFPELDVKQDKDAVGNFRLVKQMSSTGETKMGGSRFSTSVGGTVTGFHGHIIIVDDPLNPKQAVSEVQLKTANDFVDSTLSTRKVEKSITPTILIMQRLHENDPTGNWLQKKGKKIKHICLPGEINTTAYASLVQPPELKKNYVNGLLDPNRLDNQVLQDLELDLGQYGYAGQIGQNPVPPEGGMFKIASIPIIEQMPSRVNISKVVRYWDKAGTQGGGAWTVGAKLCILKNGKIIVMDIKRGQWDTDVRESIIKSTAEADGVETLIYFEQEPGSGGKESAQSTKRNLRGFSATPDRPIGDKIYRADPFSVACNRGDVLLLRNPWNKKYLDELAFFPFGTYKDQVDASSGAYTKLAGRKEARVLGRR